MLSSCSTYRCRRRIGTKATLDAHHILRPYRLPDRYRHGQRGLPKTGKHAIDRADQFDQLLRCDLMMPYVAANDAHDLMEITSSAEASSARTARPVERNYIGCRGPSRLR